MLYMNNWRHFLNNLFRLYALLLGLMALAAPILAYAKLFAEAGTVYGWFSHLCHQHSDRSIWLLGYPIACCARCLGIYAGSAFFPKRWLTGRTMIYLLGLTVLAVVLEKVVVEDYLRSNPGNVVRLFTGTMMGGTVAGIVLKISQEISLITKRFLQPSR